MRDKTHLEVTALTRVVDGEVKMNDLNDNVTDSHHIEERGEATWRLAW